MNTTQFIVGMSVGIVLCLTGSSVGLWRAKREAKRAEQRAEEAKRVFEAEMTTRGVPEVIAITVAALIEYHRPDVAAHWLISDLAIRQPDPFTPPEEGVDERC